MLDKGISFFVNNKIIVFVVMALIIVIGMVTSPFDLGGDYIPKSPIAVDAIPNIGENQQIVFTEWAGQSPQDIEDQITYPLSSNLLGIPGVKSVRSNSMFGFSSIYVIFEDDIDFYWSRSRIVEKLSALPKGLLPLNVQPQLGPDATALGQIFWYTLEGRDENGNVTGGWDLQELRSIQDFYVKNALVSGKGVSEVASIGGYVKEYQIDVKPELLKQYNVSLNQVVSAVKESNRDIGAQTIEINKVEYFVRGLGYIKNIKDLEGTSISNQGTVPIRLKDVANVSFGPAERRGILDKDGAEVVGGVVTSRYNANPMQVLSSLKELILKVNQGLPEKKLKDGRISKLTIVPFYDRSVLINETLNTLGKALTLEILIAILVVIVMLRNLKVSLIISGLLPLAILLVFIFMRLFKVDANIVALSGIAIAIGTMIDMGIILAENINRHVTLNYSGTAPKEIVLAATKEVSGAIITAGLTTIVSFIPVFSLIGTEGKLFTPLAFTKTVSLVAAMSITLLIIPPIYALLLKKKKKNSDFVQAGLLIFLGIFAVFKGVFIGLLLIVFGLLGLLLSFNRIKPEYFDKINYWVTVFTVIICLTVYWRPLGIGYNLLTNTLFICLIIIGVLLPIRLFMNYYKDILIWVLNHKIVGIMVPLILMFLGFVAFLDLEKEFMPNLDEGDFLLMPTSMPHAGVEQNKSVLKQLDMAVSSLPEVEYVVGKAGRVESALDPAPLSMYENLIAYKPEYLSDEHGPPLRFEVNEEGLFKTKSGHLITSGSDVSVDELILADDGDYYRNWRSHIKNENDIWNEIAKVSKLPGVTSAPKLQPIATRLVMLQSGMRSPLGIKISGQDIETIERFGLKIENIIKRVDGIVPESVFADRIIGKPYLLFDIDRFKISQYGLTINEVQNAIEASVGGKLLTHTVEGRERYAVRIRYPRALRNSPEQLEMINVSLPNGSIVPIKEFVDIKYKRGPQSIKSENGFLIGYVIFDKNDFVSEVSIVERAKKAIERAIENKDLVVPQGVSYHFSGTYESHLRSQKYLSFIIPLTLVIIFLILYVQFKSVRMSFIIFSSVTVALTGGFILVWLFGQPWFMNISIFEIDLRDLFNIKTVNLSVAVWVGFIALFGIATDDAVVMGTYLNQQFKDQVMTSKLEIHNEVVKAGMKRIKPCLMTSATTILALIPILMSTSRGASIMIPMAIPCFGGMLMAIITLFIVPLLFSWQKEVILNKG